MEVLFIKFNYIDMLNQYLTNIFIFKNNLYNLYFNLKGEGIDSILIDLQNDLNKFNIYYEKLSILIKKIGGYPIMNLEEVKSISTIKQISSKDYTLKETKSILINDFKVINSMNNQVGEYALKNYDFQSINLILDFNNFLSNRIYQLKKNYNI